MKCSNTSACTATSRNGAERGRMRSGRETKTTTIKQKNEYARQRGNRKTERLSEKYNKH